jgi:hypothetical protein
VLVAVVVMYYERFVIDAVRSERSILHSMFHLSKFEYETLHPRNSDMLPWDLQDPDPHQQQVHSVQSQTVLGWFLKERLASERVVEEEETNVAESQQAHYTLSAKIHSHMKFLVRLQNQRLLPLFVIAKSFTVGSQVRDK